MRASWEEDQFSQIYPQNVAILTRALEEVDPGISK